MLKDFKSRRKNSKVWIAELEELKAVEQFFLFLAGLELIKKEDDSYTSQLF